MKLYGYVDAWICLCFREEIARKGREDVRNSGWAEADVREAGGMERTLTTAQPGAVASRVRKWPLDGADRPGTEGGRDMPTVN